MLITSLTIPVTTSFPAGQCHNINFVNAIQNNALSGGADTEREHQSVLPSPAARSLQPRRGEAGEWAAGPGVPSSR